MKIQPEHNSKKPAYYIGVALLLAALAAGGLMIKDEVAEKIKEDIEEIERLGTAGMVSAYPVIETTEVTEETVANA